MFDSDEDSQAAAEIGAMFDIDKEGRQLTLDIGQSTVTGFPI